MKLMSREQPVLVDGEPVWMRIDYQPAREKHERSRGVKTECVLLGKRAGENEEPPVLATGVAYQNPLDRYDKLKGRKLAFKDALEQLLPRGAEREGVWAWYRATVRQPEGDRIGRCPHCGKPIPLHPRPPHLVSLPAPAVAVPKGPRKTAPAARRR